MESLDRAISAAQAAIGVGDHVAEALHEQREQMGRIDADVREVDGTLKYTGYNIKHGFTWRGALTKPFRRGAKKPTQSRDISPVFTDDYVSGKTPPRSPASRAPPRSPTSRGGAAHGGAKGESKAPDGGRFSRSPRRDARTGRAAQAGKEGGYSPGAPKPPSAGHVPEGFDKQLDVLDSLVEGLAVQARAIGDELRQQNEGIEVLGDRIEPVMAQTEAQSKEIKRRFRVRG